MLEPPEVEEFDSRRTVEGRATVEAGLRAEIFRGLDSLMESCESREVWEFEREDFILWQLEDLNKAGFARGTERERGRRKVLESGLEAVTSDLWMRGERRTMVSGIWGAEFFGAVLRCTVLLAVDIVPLHLRQKID